MDQMISFRCSSCKRPLKVRADKAGRRARCRCGAEVVIPRATEPGGIDLSEPPRPPDDRGTIPLSPDRPAPAGGEAEAVRATAPSPSTPRLGLDDEAPAAPAAPPPAAAAADDEDEEEGTYTLLEAFDKPVVEIKPKRGSGEDEEDGEEGEEDDEQARKVKEQEEEALLARRKRLASTRKAPVDPAPWRKVQRGLLFLGLAAGLWTGAFCLHGLFLLIGSLAPPDYAYMASNELVSANDPPVPGRSRSLDRADFALGLLAGRGFLTLGKWIFGAAVLLLLAQLGLAAVGGLACLGAPREFGVRGQALAVVVLAGVNFLILFFFQLLPLTGLLRYTLIPFLAPEVGMLSANVDRVEPIHIAWSAVPLVELFFAMLFRVALLAQAVLLASFLRGIARSLHIDSLQQTSESLIRMGLGTTFAWLAYLLLMNSGTSDVLILVLRAVYLFATAFFLGQMVWLTLTLLGTRVSIEKVLKVGWVA
jgi:hypothetical protein